MNTINMPGFSADASLYKTKAHYRMGAAFDVFSGGPILLQQREIRTFPEPTDADGGLKERCDCRLNTTSSTGWREWCCYTLPGAGTQCRWEDECSPPPPTPPPTRCLCGTVRCCDGQWCQTITGPGGPWPC